MKKIIFLLSGGLLLTTPAMANTKCFIATEKNKTIIQEGDACKSRHSPCSTFKIVISLMGFNEGILVDETHPQLPFKEGYVDFIEAWKQPQTPTSWMKNSCVWYSQVVTPQIGMTKFKKYLREFNYGNQDVAGDQGKNNGLTNSWLSSSLQISPQEQIIFLQKLLENKLPVSAQSQVMTKKILFVEDLPQGWKFYGKTGAGSLGTDGQIGWFVGWIQKGDRNIIFAHYVEEEGKRDFGSGKRAKEAAKAKLIKWIEG